MFEIAGGIILAVLVLAFLRQIATAVGALILLLLAAAVLYGVSSSLKEWCRPKPLVSETGQPSAAVPLGNTPSTSPRQVSPFYWRYLNDQARAIRAAGGSDAEIEQFVLKDLAKPFSGTMPPESASPRACVVAEGSFPWVLLVAVLVAWGVATRNTVTEIAGMLRDTSRAHADRAARWPLAGVAIGLFGMAWSGTALEDRYGVPNPPDPLAFRLAWVAPIVISGLVCAFGLFAYLVSIVRHRARWNVRQWPESGISMPPQLGGVEHTKRLPAFNEQPSSVETSRSD